MADWLLLPVIFRGEELEFEVRAYQFGFINRIEVIIDNIPVQFELDDEENYRALVSSEQMQKSKRISVELLQAIAETLASLNR